MEPRVAIVLSGGGAKGAYEAGALSSIVKHTQAVHIVTGASIGAINAAVFACEYEKDGDPIAAATAVESAWRGIGPLFELSVAGVFTKAVLSMVQKKSLSLDAALAFPGLVDNEAIIKKIGALLPDRRISEIKRIDLAINATDLSNGRTVTFARENDAPLREAVLASSCIPILFPSRVISGSYLVDGGVFNNTPLRDALVLGATHVFVVALKPSDKDVYRETIKDARKYGSVLQVGSRLLELAMDKIMYDDLKAARRTNALLRVIADLEERGQGETAQRLKDAIEYKKGGRTKSVVEFYEIAPSGRLEPPGTLGFDQKDAILKAIDLGKEEANQQLEETLVKWEKELA